MKIRILDRILVCLAGLVLIAAGAAVIAEHFFAVPVLDSVSDFLRDENTRNIVIYCVAALLMIFLGAYCVAMLFRHRRKRQRGFVIQRTENGELSISIKAIENLVQKCIDKHEELHVLSTGLENTRDGLVIKLRIGLASGVSIPLVAGALQKQIRQYVTACSGVDVREVKVQVETASARLKASPYVVPEMMAASVANKLAGAAVGEPETVHTPVTVVPPEMETEEQKRRPLHQRLFGREEQPMDVPPPPETKTKDEPADEQPEAKNDKETASESADASQEEVETEPAKNASENATEDWNGENRTAPSSEASHSIEEEETAAYSAEEAFAALPEDHDDAFAGEACVTDAIQESTIAEESETAGTTVTEEPESDRTFEASASEGTSGETLEEEGNRETSE